MWAISRRYLSTLKLSEVVKNGQGYINGAWVGSATGKTFPVTNPATLGLITNVADMDGSDTQKAILAAQAAFPGWKSKLAKERSAVLMKWFDLITANAEELAQLMTAECGKPIVEARGEVAYGASFIQWYAEEAKRNYGEIIPETTAGRRLLVLRQPVGVCGLITPWNFPLAMITRKAAPALAVGCTAVIKPAPDTPLSALALAHLAGVAGVPNGVLNVVPASIAHTPSVGDALCKSTIVRKVSFTGSTPVGVHLMASCASTMKRLSLELGGNAPFIVFDDADVDAAVNGAIASKFRNSGQTCVCTNRMLVQDGIYDEFVKKLSARVSALTIGNGATEGTQLGPLINAAGVQKTERLVGDAVKKGAKVAVGGERPTFSDSTLKGNFYKATVLTNVTQDMAIMSEEVFGPVLPIYRFKTDDEAVKVANSTNSGLAGYFYTQNLGRAWRVAEALEVGMVAVNEGILSSEAVPFGGMKMSGLGREGGHHGMDEYLEDKYVCLGLGK